MSWKIDVTGTKSAVAKKVTEELDKIAAGFEEAKAKAKEQAAKTAAALKAKGKQPQKPDYEDNEEAKDVALGKDRILALVSAVDLSPDETTAWNAVNVKAAGAHNLSANGIVDARFVISITRTHIELT